MMNHSIRRTLLMGQSSAMLYSSLPSPHSVPSVGAADLRAIRAQGRP